MLCTKTGVDDGNNNLFSDYDDYKFNAVTMAKIEKFYFQKNGINPRIMDEFFYQNKRPRIVAEK